MGCDTCEYQECEGRDGFIVCDLDGESHEPTYICNDYQTGRTYCGLTHRDMREVMDKLCNIEDRLEENDSGEIDALNIAIQCTEDIMNMMANKSFNWEFD